MLCFLKFVCNDVLSLMHAFLLQSSGLFCIFPLSGQVVIDFCMKSCDILASGGVWGHFLIDFGCFGRP